MLLSLNRKVLKQNKYCAPQGPNFRNIEAAFTFHPRVAIDRNNLVLCCSFKKEKILFHPRENFFSHTWCRFIVNFTQCYAMLSDLSFLVSEISTGVFAFLPTLNSIAVKQRNSRKKSEKKSTKINIFADLYC